MKDSWTVRIFATDIDTAALDFARVGRYPVSAAAELPPALRARYFAETGSGNNKVLEVLPVLRHLMVFVPHNLLSNPPFISMNLIFCRNVMIFLKRDAKDTILSQLHRSLLSPHGFLVLGAAEQPGPGGDTLFRPLASCSHIYRPAKIEKSSSFGKGLQHVYTPWDALDLTPQPLLEPPAPSFPPECMQLLQSLLQCKKSTNCVRRNFKQRTN